MYPQRYYARAYFAATYWPDGSEVAIEDQFFEISAFVVRRRSLERIRRHVAMRSAAYGTYGRR